MAVPKGQIGEDAVRAALASATGPIDVNGQNITDVGTVDGRDASTDGTKLDSIANWLSRPAVKAIGAVYFNNQNADGTTLTIGTRVYEVDSDATFPESAGDVAVDTSEAGDVAAEITAFAAAINGDGSAVVTATADTVNNTLFLAAKTAGVAGNAIALVTDLGGVALSGETLTGGAAAAVSQVYARRHVVVESETPLGILRFPTGLTSIAIAVVQYQSGDTGENEAIRHAIEGSDIVVTYVGSWNAGDIITVMAIGTV